MTDPIADMLTRIRNASSAKKETVIVPYSKFKMEIAGLLQRENYIKEAVRRGRAVRKHIKITLSYKDNRPAIDQIKHVSKPSCRVYVSLKEMRPVRQGHGMRILSTPRGILTDQEARKQKVGGEVIAEIW